MSEKNLKINLFLKASKVNINLKKVKTMSVSGPFGVPTQPNYFTEKENLVACNQDTSLSKVILEGGTKSTPSSLQAKKVAPVSSESVLEQGETGYVPLMFRGTRKKAKSIQSYINGVKTIQEIAQERRLNKDPKHRLNEELSLEAIRIVCLFAKSKLAHMEGVDKVEKNCIEIANKELTAYLKGNYFDGQIQFAAYMGKVYPEIQETDLVNMNVLRDLLLTLRRATILDPEFVNTSEELESIKEFLHKHWEKLKIEDQLDEETFNRLNENLEQVLKEDPFKDEFIKNPELFKKVKDAPPALLEKYPHLTSPGRFIERYPRAGWIELPNQTFNTENLKLCINQAKTSPLATTLILDSVDPIITPSHAHLIKNLLVEKQNLTVSMGNEEDLATIMTAFYDDPKLVFDKMTTFLASSGTLGDDRKVVVFTINPQSPIRKVQPQSEAKKTDSSLQGKPTLIDGRVFLVLDGANGSKVLAVRDYEVEAVLKLNRKYIDENGITQEYRILGVGPEYYEKLDTIEGRIKEKHASNIESMIQKHSSNK